MRATDAEEEGDDTVTRNDIEERIAAIRYAAVEYDDDEIAHSREDDLRRHFIAALALGKIAPEHVEEFAKLILSTANIKFARWCS